MPDSPENAINLLMQGDPHIIAGAVLKGSEIIYSTDNWDISADVSRILSSWMGQNAQFIHVSGVKYSVLQMEAVRLVAMSYKGEGSIVAAKDDEYKVFIYLDPDGYALGAVMEVQRALGSLTDQAEYIDAGAQLGGGQDQTMAAASVAAPVVAAASGGASVDPQLKGEITAFLDWIKDSEGLVGYINYYLQQNNAQIISELSKIYGELRQIFGV